MFLTWQPIYSVNIKEIDEQHQKIFSIINNLFEIKNNQSQASIDLIVKELKDYGSYHLETEEKYFKLFNYPDTKFHIAQHNGYRNKVLDFESKINESNDDILIINELTEFLKNWWLYHIQNTDQQYSAFFNSKGLV